MKIDMHTHCKPISACAHHMPEEIPLMHKNAGVDAIVLTNHYYPDHLVRISQQPALQAQAYVDTFHKCRDAGNKIGVKVFFGCEVKLINVENKPEFLLYGISTETFLKSFPLYGLSQIQLFKFCDENDIVMIQAHPFRHEQGYQPADIRFMHGAEVLNPHPLFDMRREQATEFAGDKIKTAGTDFHVVSQAGGAGMCFDEEITDQFCLRDALKAGRGTIYYK